MSVDEVRPAKRLFVTIAEVRWELVPTGKLTWPETVEAKRISGMPIVDMEVGIGKADPDAWFAWMYVSIRRKRPTLTEAELMAAIGDTPLVAVIESVEEEGPEVADPDPLAQPLTSDDAAEPNGSGSSEKIPPLSIPETSGHLSSQTRS